MVKVTQDDLSMLKPILDKGIFEPPTIKISIYKNRRGRYNNLLLWCKSRLGVCKIDPMFATTYNYELIEIEDLRIQVEDSFNITK